MEHIIAPNLNFQELAIQLNNFKLALEEILDGEELTQPEPIFLVSGKHSRDSSAVASVSYPLGSVDGESPNKMVKNVGLNRLKIENGFKIKKYKSKKDLTALLEQRKERQPTADSSDLSEGALALNTGDDIFKCEYCTKVFQSSQQLGGHVSRGHPGKSVAYQKKQETRDRREIEREMLKEAKRIFRDTTGRDPKQFRGRVTQIKKELLAQLPSD